MPKCIENAFATNISTKKNEIKMRNIARSREAENTPINPYLIN